MGSFMEYNPNYYDIVLNMVYSIYNSVYSNIVMWDYSMWVGIVVIIGAVIIVAVIFCFIF